MKGVKGSVGFYMEKNMYKERHARHTARRPAGDVTKPRHPFHKDQVDTTKTISVSIANLKLHRGLQGDPGHASPAWIANKPPMVVENAMPARAGIAAGPRAWSRDRARDERTRSPIIGDAVSAPMTTLSGARTPGSFHAGQSVVKGR